MKKITTLSFAFLTMAMFSANVSNAAFPIKQEAATTQSSAATTAAPENVTVLNQNPEIQSQVTTSATKATAKSGSAAMPAILYIILAILGLGWLAMGINDNFGDFDWLISLILYILFYIPGLIYTLIKMSKYY